MTERCPQCGQEICTRSAYEHYVENDVKARLVVGYLGAGLVAFAIGVVLLLIIFHGGH